eukprot:TRINITY_DN3017_c0_g1_i5.p1 TRINITY_DN3017_c0_g1~~TRINITY_DN3017_c0_g1_i5.p1  ORF type:complete len:316 (-),score=19.19 TRINITY_DN3017_c0_g1_i5:7-894(-)
MCIRDRFTYVAAWEQAKTVVNKSGVKDLWRGNSANLLRVFPYAALQFSFFDLFRANLQSDSYAQTKRNFINFICGGSAGSCATAITYPLDFLRTRLAMHRIDRPYKGIGDAVARIYREEGVRTFYTGLPVTIMGIIPYHGMGFFMFHYFKDIIRKHHPEWSKSKIFDFLFGATAGFIAQLSAYPFEIWRKRLQAQSYLVKLGELDKARSPIEYLLHIIKTEGFRRGLYKGVTVNIVKGPLGTGTSFTIKNLGNRWLDKSFKDQMQPYYMCIHIIYSISEKSNSTFCFLIRVFPQK